ncbi:MAG: sugar ABC transporter permease [Firmicutes bacterium]|nr:sugar ABC transporter permease [Bacillota bacterium]
MRVIASSAGNFLRKHVYVAFILPALLIYVVFLVYPLLSSLYYGFFQWDGITRGAFMGLANFKKLLAESPYNVRFFSALKHNIHFFLMTMAVQNLVGLAFALILSRGIRGASVYQTIFFMPYTMSVIVLGFLWSLILNPTWGVFNKLLATVGLSGLARPWLGDMATALPAITLVNAWHWVGFPMLVFLAGLEAIPAELHEAARLDGAGGWKLFRRITMPLLMPSITIVTILTFIGNFNAFEIIFAMEGSSGGPYYATDVLGTLFYRTAFGEAGGFSGQDIGLGSAIAAVMFVIIFAISYLGTRFMRSREMQY